LGLFLNTREKDAMLVRDKVLEVATPLEIEVVDLRSPPAQDMLRGNPQKLRDRSITVDTVYLPADGVLGSNTKLLGAELRSVEGRSE
jgi:hypothetical protein